MQSASQVDVHTCLELLSPDRDYAAPALAFARVDAMLEDEDALPRNVVEYFWDQFDECVHNSCALRYTIRSCVTSRGEELRARLMLLGQQAACFKGVTAERVDSAKREASKLLWCAMQKLEPWKNTIRYSEHMHLVTQLEQLVISLDRSSDVLTYI
jgi:hypothetical protein